MRSSSKPAFSNFARVKRGDWINVIDMELVAQIDEREQQRKQREHALIAIFHVQHVFDLSWLEGKGFATLDHDLAQLSGGEPLGPTRLNRLTQRGQERVEAAAPNARCLEQRTD